MKNIKKEGNSCTGIPRKVSIKVFLPRWSSLNSAMSEILKPHEYKRNGVTAFASS